MAAPKTLTLTVAEAEQLFEAAEYARKNRWQPHPGDDLTNLNSAIRKLRRAEVLIIEQEA